MGVCKDCGDVSVAQGRRFCFKCGARVQEGETTSPTQEVGEKGEKGGEEGEGGEEKATTTVGGGSEGQNNHNNNEDEESGKTTNPSPPSSPLSLRVVAETTNPTRTHTLPRSPTEQELAFNDADFLAFLDDNNDNNKKEEGKSGVEVQFLDFDSSSLGVPSSEELSNAMALLESFE